MTITKEMRDKVPEALYGCATGDCATEVSYPADHLRWWRDGFYCVNCINELSPCPEDPEDDGGKSEVEYDARFDGVSLDKVLQELDE